MEPVSFSIKMWKTDNCYNGEVQYDVRLFVGIDDFDKHGIFSTRVERRVVEQHADLTDVIGRYQKLTGATNIVEVGHTRFWFRCPVTVNAAVYKCAMGKVILCQNDFPILERVLWADEDGSSWVTCQEILDTLKDSTIATSFSDLSLIEEDK